LALKLPTKKPIRGRRFFPTPIGGRGRRGPTPGDVRSESHDTPLRGVRIETAVTSKFGVKHSVCTFGSCLAMVGNLPARLDFMVIFADCFTGKNALPLATAPLLAAARPMRARTVPRPAPDTARLVIDMQREADIAESGADGMATWSGRNQNPKNLSSKLGEKPLTA